MKLQEFKNSLIDTDNEFELGFKIFLCEDNYFLAKQYLEALSNKLNKEIQFIKNIHQVYNDNMILITDTTDTLNVLITDTFDEVVEDYYALTDLVVICKKVDKAISSQVEEFIVKFQKPLDWQVKAYMLTLCPGLTEHEADYLYDNTDGDIYKIDNEVSKISIFGLDQQIKIFNELKYAVDSDLFKLTLFDLADAILKNDRGSIIDYYKHAKLCNFDPIALVNILLNNLKKIVLVAPGSNTSCEDLKITKQQYSAIKYKYANYSIARAQKAIKFLSHVDQRLKMNQLDFNKNALIDYVIVNLTTI